MHTLYMVIMILLIGISCKRDKNAASLGGSSCSDYIYNQKTSANFDYVLDSLPSMSVFGQSSMRQEPILFTNPVFNPNNDYEICYIKDINSSPNGKELWKYNFCNGLKIKLASNLFYSLDWSVKNWLIFTGFDQEIYKIKSNGDSLIKLTSNGGIHAVGKWSPDGSKFWFIDGGTTCHICDENGITTNTFSTNFNNLDWKDNDNLLVNWGGNFCNYNIVSQNLSSPIHTSTVGIKLFSLFNSKNNTCIWENNVSKKAEPQFLLKWDLKSSKVDTIKRVYFSYKYLSGDYNKRTNKLVLELYRAKWFNQLYDKIQYRTNIVIMNSDGTNERILNLN